MLMSVRGGGLCSLLLCYVVMLRVLLLNAYSNLRMNGQIFTKFCPLHRHVYE
jgi:hypothetical protein